jgi:PadR family transcriptional regulator PadR
MKDDIPQGTLDLLILKILSREPLHGYGITQRLNDLTGGAFQVNPGSLFPALYRLEQDGMLKAEWQSTENSRNAKYYSVTRTGKKYLQQEQKRWDRVTMAISSVLEGA